MIGATLGATVCVGVSVVTTTLWPATFLVTVFFVVYSKWRTT
ncbi:hypothetical protein [Cryptosporangium sp. NPDC051539]